MCTLATQAKSQLENHNLPQMNKIRLSLNSESKHIKCRLVAMNFWVTALANWFIEMQMEKQALILIQLQMKAMSHAMKKVKFGTQSSGDFPVATRSAELTHVLCIFKRTRMFIASLGMKMTELMNFIGWILSVTSERPSWDSPFTIQSRRNGDKFTLKEPLYSLSGFWRTRNQRLLKLKLMKMDRISWFIMIRNCWSRKAENWLRNSYLFFKLTSPLVLMKEARSSLMSTQLYRSSSSKSEILYSSTSNPGQYVAMAI